VTLSIPTVAVHGRWIKHTYPGSPPLPEREPPPDNRWQRGDVVDALYLADTEETAWAEWYRHLTERMIPPLAQMPRELWTWQVDVEVADLSTPEKLAAVGRRPRVTRAEVSAAQGTRPLRPLVRTQDAPRPIVPMRLFRLRLFAGLQVRGYAARCCPHVWADATCQLSGGVPSGGHRDLYREGPPCGRVA
jgi:hypothetical protein